MLPFSTYSSFYWSLMQSLFSIFQMSSFYVHVSIVPNPSSHFQVQGIFVASSRHFCGHLHGFFKAFFFRDLFKFIQPGASTLSLREGVRVF